MTKFKYCLKNITLLNILLIATIVLFANYTLFLMFVEKIKYVLPSMTRSASEEIKTIEEPPPPSSSDYIAISEQNVFHPERRIPPEKKEETPLPKPEFVLYGTLITGDTSLAYLEDQKAPRNTPGRGKRTTPLKKGDMMSGFVLKDVQADKIVMVRGEEKMVVRVYNPNRSKAAGVAAPGASSNAPQRPLSPESIIKKEPPTKNRAPMSEADERVRRFFTK
jgi:hypothetical protein